MKKRLIFLFLTVISVLAIMISTGAVAAFADNDTTPTDVDTGFVNDGAAVTPAEDVAPLYADISEFKKVASSSSKELYMLEIKGKAIVFAIKDTATGSVIYSAPANCTALGDAQVAELTNHAVLNYLDSQGVSQKANTSTAVAAGQYKLENIDNGVRITYEFPDASKGLGFTVPMTFVIKDDHFDVSVEMNAIVISEETKSDLISISVMPYFGCAEYTDDGYIFVPDGSGALIDNDFKALDGGVKYYSTYVYGRDATLNVSSKLGHVEATTLPTFGTKADDKAWVGVIETGEAVAMVKAVSARETFPYTQSYCEFMYNKSDVFQSKTSWNIKDYRQTALEPTDLEQATVRFYGLSGDDADYVGMAKSYRKFLIEKGAGSDISADLPFYADIIGAFQKTESVVGFVTDVTKAATTYTEAQEIVKSLSDLGIKNISVRYTGWMNGGTETSIVTNSKHESKLGSKQDLMDLNAIVEAQGGTTFLELELVEMYKTKSGWNENKFAVRNILNNHAEQFVYKRNTGMPITDYNYYLCRPEFFQTQVDKFFKDFSSYGIKGVSSGTLGNSNYSDLNNSEKYYRDAQQVNTAMVDALASIESNVGEQGKVMVNVGNSAMIPHADVVVGAPMYNNGYEMTYTDVPFIQIALHGLVTYTETAHNLCNDQQSQLLRQLETGTVPYYLFTEAESSVFLNTRLNYIYSSQINTWKDTAASDYRTLADVLNGYCDKEITDHVLITNDVRATTYDNDRVVIVNYGATAYKLGATAIASNDYAVMTVDAFNDAIKPAETDTAEVENGGEAQ